MRNAIEPCNLDEKDAAQFLGISVRKLFDLRKKGQIPYYRPDDDGRRVLYPVETLRRFVHQKAEAAMIAARIDE